MINDVVTAKVHNHYPSVFGYEEHRLQTIGGKKTSFSKAVGLAPFPIHIFRKGPHQLAVIYFFLSQDLHLYYICDVRVGLKMPCGC